MLPTTDKARIGLLGEEAAIDLLRRQGLRIVARNWRSGSYELDIVALQRGVLYFIEVKTRRAASLTSPEEALTPHKIRSLQHAARAFLAANGARYDGYDVQFDLVTVRHNDLGELQLERIEQAIELGW